MFVLPLVYMNDSNGYLKHLKHIDKLVGHFSDCLATEYVPIINHCNNVFSQIRSNHIYIYGGGTGGGHSPNMEEHCNNFGWIDTLCNLADKQVFGTYNQTQSANLFDVLEYLNCTYSRNIASNMDYDLKNK